MIVQTMVQGEVELVVGLKHDPVFGAVVAAGLSGLYVEVLKDVALRKAPVTEAEAARMLDELKSGAILDRLLRHAVTLNIRGNSHWAHCRKKRSLVNGRY